MVLIGFSWDIFFCLFYTRRIKCRFFMNLGVHIYNVEMCVSICVRNFLTFWNIFFDGRSICSHVPKWIFAYIGAILLNLTQINKPPYEKYFTLSTRAHTDSASHNCLKYCLDNIVCILICLSNKIMINLLNFCLLLLMCCLGPL